jgi:hypothetical protein
MKIKTHCGFIPQCGAQRFPPNEFYHESVTNEEKNMKKKENMKLRDVKPASDPKGGRQHQHFPKGGGRKEPVGGPRGPRTQQLP